MLEVNKASAWQDNAWLRLYLHQQQANPVGQLQTLFLILGKTPDAASLRLSVYFFARPSWTLALALCLGLCFWLRLYWLCT